MHFSTRVLLPLSLLVATGAACAEDDPEAAMRSLVAAFNAQDAAGVAELFHADGRLLPPGEPMITGAEAIQAYWQGAFDAGFSGIEKTPVEVVIREDLAVQTSAYVATFGDAESPGKDTLVWQRGEDGNWRITSDIWSSDR